MSSAIPTALCALHKSLSGNMVPFAGYLLPLFYPLGIRGEVLHTRSNAGLFDVSHMGQVSIVGRDRVSYIKHLAPIAYDKLADGQSALSFFLEPKKAGVIDDCIITREAQQVSIVINASRIADDMAHMESVASDFRAKGRDVTVTLIKGKSLLALQGPKAKDVIADLASGLDTLPFMHRATVTVDSDSLTVTRCGYTGEDGFEISVSDAKATLLAERLLRNPAVKMIGLGARDGLRLEAGLCLYGHELSLDVTPPMAKLMWCAPKARLEEGFLGSDVLKSLLANEAVNVPSVRIGLTSSGPVPRQGARVYSGEKEVGIVTSGGYSPTLSKNIAMAYIQREYTKVGTQLVSKVRDADVVSTVAALPFVPSRYYKPKA